MIPKCKTYRVRVVDDDGREIERLHVVTCTRYLARLIVRQDYPSTWGHRLIISVPRTQGG